MTSPYLLPDWLPWWIALILVLIGLVYALILLLVPFSVFGVKPRLEAIEEQLLSMQEDLRSMALRLNAGPRPAEGRRGGFADPDETLLPPRPAAPRPAGADPAPIPPIPPPPREPLREPLSREPTRQRSTTPQRVVGKRIEPRLD